ncbi:peptidoglycan-binding domain-containing protein [Salana multivorans]
MKRIVGWLLVMIVVAAGTWIVATRMESPEQVAAAAEPPSPVAVTAPLRAGYVQGRMTLTLTAAQDQRDVSGGSGVVTRTAVAAGETLFAGAFLANVDGRPRIALTGPFALYRDLASGDRGDDVAALQAALVEAGYGTGRDEDGVFGAGTLAALKKLYKNAGAALPTRMPEESTAASAVAEDATPAPPQPVSYLPAAEIVMIQGLPATVAHVAGIGQSLDAEHPLLRLLSGDLRLASTVPTASRGSLVVGAQGTFSDADGSAQTATVVAIDASPDGASVTIVTDAPGRVEVGGSYVLTVDNPAAESGEAILAPVAGIVTRGGRTFVYPLRDGEFTEVEVAVTASAGGVAAVVAVDPAAELSPGTEIRVG